MTPQDTAILVLGMHRSGTSVATRVLSLLGAELGDHLLSPQADNKKGFWEHAQAVEIHERLLASLGRSWHDMRELPPGWEDSPAALAAVDEITTLIQRDFKGKRLWAVKDPRMCRLAPVWLAAFRRLSIRATALLMVRDPLEVADSLKARDNWPHGQSYVLWARYLAESLRVSAGLPRAMLTYDDLLAEWRAQMERIRQQLGVEWAVGAEQAIDEFISPGERHHGSTGDSHRLRGVPVLVRQMLQACKDTISTGSWATLEGLEATFAALTGLFDQSLDDVIVARDEFARLSHERMERIFQLDQENHRLTSERRTFELLALERIERIMHLNAEYIAKVQQCSMLEERLRAASDGLERMTAEHSSQCSMLEERLRATSDGLERMTAEHSSHCSMLEERLRAASDGLERMTAEHSSLIEERAEARSQAEERLARLNDALVAAGDAQYAAGQSAGELEALKARVRSRRWLVTQVLRPSRH
ncbi:MAG TPA: sulfotransferase [Rhodanobacter sp.]|nr:sulfotransferase [Rhodanobacter sp.]